MVCKVGGRYRVGKLLGAGTFGTVYLARDIKKGQDVAVKLKIALEWGSRLEHKCNVYQAISGIHRIPKMLWYGMEGTLLFTSHSKLSVLKSLHDHHYVHLNIKPDNFMIGTGNRSSQVFLIDFRLTQLFCNPDIHEHIMQVKGLDITGTSLAYVIIYLVKGQLPWQGIIIHPSQVHHDKVLKLKQVTIARALCNGLPQPFIKFIQHIQSLKFEDKPDYWYLYSLLTQCILPLNQMPLTTQTVPLLVTG
ncbi:kinase-like domain-containing protein [Russula dissimulans]|nr:kinase-like domain-containing protein [Russula dissimulans]